MTDAIQVTRSIAPDLATYSAYLEQIFSSQHFTNHGPCSVQLENALKEYLKLANLAVCANGTLAIQLALRISGLTGKRVITSPFSYVATVSALLWEGCTPVFADIDEETLCLDPARLAEKISPDTAGILPVHIYGNICDVDAIEAAANKAALPVLYDAAQCFGSKFRGKSVLDYGDYATCSFHATKVFHTVEGGCVITRAAEGIEGLRLLRACGHTGDKHIMPGTNAKISELHAAMGLSLLGLVEKNIQARAQVSKIYDALLPATGLRRPVLRAGLDYNHAYYPVIFETEAALQRILKHLNQENIFPRRYFFPALNTLPYLPEKQSCPVAESVAPRILCLPLYAELSEPVIANIATIIKNAL